MAATDFNTSLPVRSEADGTDARVQVKIVDRLNPDTKQMDVDSDHNAHVEMHGNAPDGTTDKVMRLSEEGAPNGDGVYDGTNNSTPASAGITAQVRNATASPSRQTMQPTAVRGSTASTQVSLDVALHDEAGEAYSSSNPMPVAIVNEETGTAIHDYWESPAVLAPGASVTRTYTVATSILSLKRILASASGRIKVEILTGPSGLPVQKYTLFNSSSNPNVEHECPKNFLVAVSDVVQVKFTNMDKQSFTVYTTIEGSSGL